MSLYRNKLDPTELNQRRRAALSKIDNAEFGWFHIRACLVAGVGFFTDAYDLFAINLVTPMLGLVYYGGDMPASVDLGIKVSASIGTFIGQVFFGWLADRLGRKRMYGIELMIIIVATLGQALSGVGSKLSLPAALIIWRLILGVGVGGDYPLSAVITSEFATTNRRGAMMAAVFAMQGFGYLTTGVVALILLAGFKDSIIAEGDNPASLDYVWRVLIGFGCVPALVAVYFRLTIPETPRYVIDVENNLRRAERDVDHVLSDTKRNNLHADDDIEIVRNEAVVKGTWADFRRYFGKWMNLKILIGTSVTWFALDVAFYGIGLNNSFILSSINFSSVHGNAYATMWNSAVGQIIIVLLGAVPGYWVTVFTIERLGRVRIQLIGFVMSCIFFCVLGFAYDKIKATSIALFITLFALTQFFQNFGPNSTTFIIPGEVFPTRYRSTGHGISAGAGKLGAIVAQVGFSQLKDRGGKNAFIPQLLQIFALFMFIGLVFTFLIPETKGKTLEELSNEEEPEAAPTTLSEVPHVRQNALFDEK
ncbi:Inorganic phosphate transporter pho84 [Actinomortierella ambigua]|nr:Inorganic phosphate transporter pho84 [Actinomortierella ambigua]